MIQTSSPAVVHLVYVVACGAAFVYLVNRPRPSLWLVMVSGLIAGAYVEMANDAWLPLSIVIYPEPRLLTLPGSQIPLTIVVGWGAFAVLIRLAADWIFRVAGGRTIRASGLLAYVALLAVISLLWGVLIETAAVALGGWVYRYHSGVPFFPILFLGPYPWVVMVLITNAIAEAVTWALLRAGPLLGMAPEDPGH